jgi:hypothetical protein
MLKNSVGDVNELAYVKQIGDQDIARGNPPLDVGSNLELLLSACSTYDKNHAIAMKHKRNVYTMVVGEDNDIQSDDTGGLVMNHTMKPLQWIPISQKSSRMNLYAPAER